MEGRLTELRRSDTERLKEVLGKHLDSPAYRSDAALAALQLARAAQERAARRGKRGALKTACRYFHIAVGLHAPLQSRDKTFMEHWWPRLKPSPKKKVEAEVRRFLAGTQRGPGKFRVGAGIWNQRNSQRIAKKNARRLGAHD